MKLIVLPSETRATTGFNRKLIITWEDIKTWTSGTAQAVVPVNALGKTDYTLLAGTIIQRVAAYVVTAFAGDASNDITLTLLLGFGTSANVYAFIGAAGPTGVNLKATGWMVTTKTAQQFTADDTIDAVATAGVDAITTLTAGEVHILLDVVDPNDLVEIGQP